MPPRLADVTDHDGREAKEEGRAPALESLLPVPVRVSRVRREMSGVTTLELTPAFAVRFVPGQFNMLYMFGLGEVAIRDGPPQLATPANLSP